MSIEKVKIKGLRGYVDTSEETVEVEGAKGCLCFDVGGFCKNFLESVTITATITEDTVPEIFITPNAPTSTTVTVAFKSITANLTMATAEWSIGDDYYATSPISETGWTAFKSTYVSDGSVSESLLVDFNQWALDNGYLSGSKHKFCVDLFVTSSEGCVSDTKSFCYNTTIFTTSGKTTEDGTQKTTENGIVKIVES